MYVSILLSPCSPHYHLLHREYPITALPSKVTVATRDEQQIYIWFGYGDISLENKYPAKLIGARWPGDLRQAGQSVRCMVTTNTPHVVTNLWGCCINTLTLSIPYFSDSPKIQCFRWIKIFSKQIFWSYRYGLMGQILLQHLKILTQCLGLKWNSALFLTNFRLCILQHLCVKGETMIFLHHTISSNVGNML